MDLLTQDFRVSIRTLMARPAFTAAAVLTLALGIGATTTVFSIVFGVLLEPLPYSGAERIVAVGQTARSAPGRPVDGSVSPVSVADWKQVRSLAHVALYTGTNAVVTGGGEPLLMRAAMVTPAFFDVMGAPMVLGRGFTAEEDLPTGPAAVIISYGLWKERFAGDPNVIGRTLDISGRPRPIVGVAPEGFDYPDKARLWSPVKNEPDGCGRGCVYLQGIARMADGVTLAVAQQEMNSLAEGLEKEYPGSNTDVIFALMPLRDYLVGEVRRPLLIMLGAILMVLLIACANVANLLLVRGAGRSGEMAVRATLGAARSRLIQQLLTESTVIAGIGAGLGLIFAHWALDLILFLSPGDLPRLDEVSIGGPGISFALGLTGVTALLFGLYPALQLTRTSLASALRAGGRGNTGPGNSLGRSLLLAGEVGFSVVLLLGAGLLLRSFMQIQAVKLGFDDENLYEFSLSLPGSRYEKPEQIFAFFEQVRERMAALPGVERVAVVTSPPLGTSDYVAGLRRLDQPPPEPGQGVSAGVRTFDHNGLQTLRIPLLSGRGFEATDGPRSLQVMLINRAAAREFFGAEDPIGKQINTGIGFNYDQPDAYTIIGVVGDVRGVGITTEPRPEIYLAQAQTAPSSATVMIRTRAPAPNLLAQARAEVKRLDPGLPLVRPGSTADVVASRMAAPRFYMSLLIGFAGLAIVLAAIGIYGVVAYLVAQRRREIGVRLALGANIANVVRIVLWQGLKPALAGIIAGVAGALALGHVMAALLYGVGARDPFTFIAVPVLVVSTVVLACVVPARRASLTSPAVALRSEQI